jgi:hypothetical protein
MYVNCQSTKPGALHPERCRATATDAINCGPVVRAFAKRLGERRKRPMKVIVAAMRSAGSDL